MLQTLPLMLRQLGLLWGVATYTCSVIGLNPVKPMRKEHHEGIHHRV